MLFLQAKISEVPDFEDAEDIDEMLLENADSMDVGGSEVIMNADKAGKFFIEKLSLLNNKHRYTDLTQRELQTRKKLHFSDLV